jgi:hypothetical protein
MFINGWSIEESTKTFKRLTKTAFKRQKVLKVPIFCSMNEIAPYCRELYANWKKVFGLNWQFGIIDIDAVKTKEDKSVISNGQSILQYKIN